MSGIKIVTDSTADLPVTLVNEYNICVVPLKVIFEDEIYREGIDITTGQFYEKLAAAKQLPKTSQPAPGEFEQVYKELTSDGSTVLSIHLSAELSGTYQSALLARNSLPDKDIRVIDSKQVSMALGMLVITAAKAVRDKKNADEIVDIVLNLAKKVKTFFIVETLENLQKGGRIGKAAALLGNILNIKPVLTIEDGIVVPFEKVRGKGKALERIINILKDYISLNGLSFCALLHANCLKDAISFHQSLTSEINACEFMIGDIGAVVGTHGGIGLMGVIFC